MGWQMLSMLWALFYRIAPGEWLIGLALGWWGLVRQGRGEGSAVLYSAAVLVIVLGQIARAMEYRIFVPGYDSTVGAAPTQPTPAFVTGDLSGFLHPSLPLVTRRFSLGAPANLHWISDVRPPHLLVVWPPSATLPIRHESAARWSSWYPGSSVHTGTVYFRGRALPGLLLAFAGRSLAIGCPDASALVGIRDLLATE